MAIHKILIVDDEVLIRGFLTETLKRKNYEIKSAENGKKAIEILEKENFDLIITDMKMPIKNGFDVLNFVKANQPQALVIIMTAFGSIDNAVDAMKQGAFHYLIKPFSPENIETIIDKANEHKMLIKENDLLRSEIYGKKIIAHSPSMKKILMQLPKIAESSASVFICGESGTGKEIIAQFIHSLSSRCKRPFIRVNCAAIAESLIESEFFGYEKGAFTGANARKEGRFEVANGGTLLLDEITEIPLSLQPKLLRAIQELEFERVGSTSPIKVNIRFISTSNRNITEAITKNIFREDLFYRLNVMPIFLPPLRERKEDILPLAQHFLEKFCKENHKPIKKLSDAAEDRLLYYPWPGNVRELANIIERTVVLDIAQVIEPDHIYLDSSFNAKGKEDFSSLIGLSLEEVEKKLILSTLKKEKNNRKKASESLGITMRTLRNKLKIYNEKENRQESLFDIS